VRDRIGTHRQAAYQVVSDTRRIERLSYCSAGEIQVLTSADGPPEVYIIVAATARREEKRLLAPLISPRQHEVAELIAQPTCAQDGACGLEGSLVHGSAVSVRGAAAVLIATLGAAR
jgi:hypothetical protein